MLRKIILLNSTSVVIFILLGLLTNCIQNNGFFVSQTFEPILKSPQENFFEIYKSNMTVFLKVVCGLPTFGVYPYLILCWNSFFLGTGITTFLSYVGNNNLYLCSYLVFEFISITLLTATVEAIGIKILFFLVGHPVLLNLREAITTLFKSIFFITLAGIMETCYIYLH